MTSTIKYTPSTTVILKGRNNAIRYFLQDKQNVYTAQITAAIENVTEDVTNIVKDVETTDAQQPTQETHHDMLLTEQTALKELDAELTDPDLLWLCINPKVEAAFLHNLGRFAMGQLYGKAEKKPIGGKGYPTQFVKVLWQRSANVRKWLVLTLRDVSLETRVTEFGATHGKDSYFYLDHSDVRYIIYRMKPEDDVDELFKLFWELAQQSGMRDEALPNIHVNKDGRLPFVLDVELLHTTLCLDDKDNTLS